MNNLPKAIDLIEVGDVFVSSWGYEQTNVDFFRVTRKTKAMIELSSIPALSRGATGWASDTVSPDLAAKPGAPIGLRRPTAFFFGGKTTVRCGIDSVSSASKVDDPASYSTYRSWYA